MALIYDILPDPEAAYSAEFNLNRHLLNFTSSRTRIEYASKCSCDAQGEQGYKYYLVLERHNPACSGCLVERSTSKLLLLPLAPRTIYALVRSPLPYTLLIDPSPISSDHVLLDVHLITPSIREKTANAKVPALM